MISKCQIHKIKNRLTKIAPSLFGRNGCKRMIEAYRSALKDMEYEIVKKMEEIK